MTVLLIRNRSTYFICGFIRSFTKSSKSKANLFDVRVKQIQRDNAFGLSNRKTFDYIRESTAINLADRLYDINKEFYLGLEIGCTRGDLLSSKIDSEKINFLFQSDSSVGALSRPNSTFPIQMHLESPQLRVSMFDIAIANLSLHWVNDLEDCFHRISKLLVPDAPFMISMFGEFTLCELSSSLREAEMKIMGGFSPRVSPFIRLSDLATLFNAGGFTLITVDQDYITVRYPGLLELMHDLGRMGESNCTVGRNTHLRRDVIRLAEEIYMKRYGEEHRNIPATFEIIYGIGWTPANM
ncbi:NADH dehydrogenase [Oopsacas minuta]|uniref:Arginine-hydroxylase NDUFAF5, mitochondrial n=1 Tax=Oopsacas minuta TaxID=111878 RepID=A0AAV7K2R0_9METZ|nr:NADH dehydrogenase [Oopsacas minuta]